MKIISDVLYWISTGLLVPVIVLLIFFFIRALILIGGFFGQYLDMRRTNVPLRKAIGELTPDGLDALEAALPQKSNTLLSAYAAKLLAANGDTVLIEKLLDEYEIAAEKDMELPKTLTKMGPMLGLMGTLIPMGPALVGLANGDIASMAYNMQVAFATTVVGLFCSAVGFVTRQVKQRWYRSDINDLEFLAGRINQKNQRQ